MTFDKATFFKLGLTATMSLGACSSTRFGPSALSGGGTPQQLQPVTTATVQSESLPPIGTSANGTTANAGAYPNANGTYPNSGDPALAGQQQQPDGSFVTVDATGTPIANSGRDLSDGVSVQKLLGTWTLVAGADRCQLNLTQTTKVGTGRYRASAPSCAVPVLSGVASWQLAGSQVQLFDNSGALISTLIQSGNRFIGTATGGVPVSMVG